MKKGYKDFDINFGYRNFKGFRELSSQNKQKFLADWQTLALHPILLCDQSWILFFDDMTQRDFLETLSRQDCAQPFCSKINKTNLDIQKCKERLELYKETENLSKCNKIDKKIAKLLDEKKNLLLEKKKVETAKQINIAVDANNINEKYINKIIKLCDYLYLHGCHEIKILVASSDKSVKSKIEYYYTKEQLENLSRLKEKLDFYNKNKNNSCELRFCELISIPKTLKEYRELWTLENVKKANEFVEETRITIANKKLSPLEAALYIYMKISDTFLYNEDENFNDGEHTIVGAFSDSKIITCAGFASMFKIAIDVLHSKKLSAEFIGTEDISYGHCFNLLKIIDPSYKVKGVYAVDITLSSKIDDDLKATGFTGFLSRFNDALYDRDSVISICTPKSRIDQTCYTFDDIMKGITRQRRGLSNDKLKAKIDKQILATNSFALAYDEVCNQVHYRTILSAYLNMMNKTDQMIDFGHIATMITNTCIDHLVYTSKLCSSSWLDLLNIDTVKNEFETKEKCAKMQTEIQQYISKKNTEPLIDYCCPIDEISSTIYDSKDKERYFSKEYFDLLEKIKQIVDEINEYTQK